MGIDPQKASGNTIILFPVQKNILCCGLAGILAFKGAGVSNQKEDPVKQLIEAFQKISTKNLQKVLSGKIKSEQYLESEDLLSGMDRSLLCLKSDLQFQSIFFNPQEFDLLVEFCKKMRDFLSEEEKVLEEQADHFHTDELEIIYSRIVLIKDILWTLEKDFLQNIKKIKALCPGTISQEGLRKYREINYLLNCLDRLEVRGRDSAGIQISFTLSDPESLHAIFREFNNRDLYNAFLTRLIPGDLINGSIQFASNSHPGREAFLSFTYKTASIIGELGRNVRELRKIISRDEILHVIANHKAFFNVSFAHTRWASVGSITEENCHPVNNFTLNGSQSNHSTNPCASHQGTSILQIPQSLKNYPFYGEGNWRINVVLNGDIDNYQKLRMVLESAGAGMIAPELTTDTKIIPLQIEKHLKAGMDLSDAFRHAVCDFEGSHAIAMQSNVEPGKTFLALKGSGQSIYVGLCRDQYILSSELYGLVEETPYFLKMDGEQPSPADDSVTGQIFILDQNSTGVEGINAIFYDGTPHNLTEADIRKAEITTRDIDRGAFPHFFLKEISESALSVKKTLRGKYRITAKKEVIFNLGEEILPKKLKKSLSKGDIKKIFVIGHGTAAVAGSAIADGLNRYLKGTNIHIEAKRASELSGFSLEHDLRDTLAIAITQSGTTTDTNRAVSMAAERGATIIAVVNRRQSDITHRANGVFYTSDGRDIEMSVASTKAFYSQIIAGHVLALFMAKTLKTMKDEAIAAELTSLEKVPRLMTGVIEKSAEIAASVHKVTGHKKYWAIVGSGPNKAAADEIRIKLSELCYKTISSDVIEDKKHIDLSSEPLILVCAAGNPEVVMGDIVKDVAIFKAHKAAVVVFTDEGETRFNGIADSVITLPRAPMPVPVILNTVAGHLWGYHAACHIDSSAVFLQEFKNRLSIEMIHPDKKDYTIYEKIADKDLHRMLDDFGAKFHEKRHSGAFSLTNVNTISDLTLLLKYAAGKLPLEDFWNDFKENNGLSPLDLLNASLGHAIDELSRPIDAIRHQAKTVTVGTSRKEELLRGILFDLLSQLGFSARNLIGKNVLTLSRIQKSLTGIKGYTLYDINNLAEDGEPVETSTVSIRKKGGIALQMKSRAEVSGTLMGTKKTIARTGNIYIGFGRSDSAPIAIIPLLKDKPGVRNLLLAHIEFNETLSLPEKIESLGDRYNDIRNMINEYNLPWDDAYLDNFSVGILLGESVEFITTKIKKTLDVK
jgi:glucosamine--fructose-6-phosphate aminotransferase (isomerizing)